MEWLAWVLIGLLLWLVSSVIIVALMAASGIANRCTCLGDYDDDNDRTCARCHE